MKTKMSWASLAENIALGALCLLLCSAMLLATPAFAGQIAAGGFHTVAIKNDGTAWAWGSNNYGELGNGTNTGSNVPVQVKGLTGVIAVAAGDTHTMALKSDGTVWVWGANNFGQLGNNTYTPSNIPIQVPGLSDVIAIAAGGGQSAAVRSDGTLWTWGNDGSGQLGILSGDPPWGDNRNIPVAVTTMSNVVAVDVGSSSMVVFKSDGTVWACGNNYGGVLGLGYASLYVTVPTQVPLANATAIAAGYLHMIALKSDGTVWAWGNNHFGQLGDGSNDDRMSPIHVAGLGGLKAVAAGTSYSLALRYDGTSWTWGDNLWGELGNGTNTNSNVPVQVSNLSDVMAVAAGSDHGVALKSDGTIWTWGWNAVGQLGNGSNVDSTVPVQVTFRSAVVYNFSGFLGPVSLGKPFKLGSTIPVRFQLTDANGNYVSYAVATLTVQQYSGATPVGDPIDATSTGGADTGNMFRYSAIENAYVYNLSTTGLSQGTWQLRVTLDNGTVETAFISLK